MNERHYAPALTAIIVGGGLLIAALLYSHELAIGQKSYVGVIQEGNLHAAENKTTELNQNGDPIMRNNGNLYMAVDYQHAVLDASRVGASIDSIVAKQFSNDVCRHANNVPSIRSDSIRKTAYVFFMENLKNGFCGTYSTADFLTVQESYDEIISANSDSEEKAILKRSFEKIFSDPSVEQLGSDVSREDVLNVAARTESPYVYMKAVELLADDSENFDNFKDSAQTELTEDSIETAHQFGAMLATCSRFRICGANSVFTWRTCVPNRCELGRDVAWYVRRQLSPEQFEYAQRYSDELTRLTRSSK